MAITVERLPAERGAVVAPIAAAGGCCCCCCCCLHTVGSIAGALSAKPPVDVLDTINHPPTAVIGTDKVEPKYTVTSEYWISTMLLSFVAFPLIFLQKNWEDDFSATVLLILVAMVLPGVQLVASLVTFIITTASKRPGKNERLRHLGRITLRAFVGTLIGLAVMAPMLTLF